MAVKAGVDEIFTTAHGSFYQCNRTNRFLLYFCGQLSVMRVEDFFILKKLVDQVDLQVMAQNADRASDYAIISPFALDRCFVLTLTDVVNLKEVLAGAKVMLELNSLLRECLGGVLV
ncbi:hypothetical protein BH24BAC1_BH24BAC1_24530 [soil metagenome]